MDLSLFEDSFYTPMRASDFGVSKATGQRCYLNHFVAHTTAPTNISFKMSDGVTNINILVNVYAAKLSAKNPVYGGTSTYRYNTTENKWSGYDTYFPDYFGRIRNLMVTFKNGLMYTNDSQTSEIHGRMIVSEFSNYCMNEEGAGMITPQSLGVSSDVVPFESTIESDDNYTDIESSEYRQYEDQYYANVKRAINSTGGKTAGEKIRSKFAIIRHIFTSRFKADRFSVKFKSYSGHNV